MISVRWRLQALEKNGERAFVLPILLRSGTPFVWCWGRCVQISGEARGVGVVAVLDGNVSGRTMISAGCRRRRLGERTVISPTLLTLSHVL